MNKFFFFNFNYQININLLDKRSVDVIGFVYKSSKLRRDIISQFDSFNRDDKKRRQKKATKKIQNEIGSFCILRASYRSLVNSIFVCTQWTH